MRVFDIQKSDGRVAKKKQLAESGWGFDRNDQVTPGRVSESPRTPQKKRENYIDFDIWDLIGNLKVSNHGSLRFGSLELRQSLDARMFFLQNIKKGTGILAHMKQK